MFSPLNLRIAGVAKFLTSFSSKVINLWVFYDIMVCNCREYYLKRHYKKCTIIWFHLYCLISIVYDLLLGLFLLRFPQLTSRFIDRPSTRFILYLSWNYNKTTQIDDG